MKQRRYPLLYLTQGKTEKGPSYFDPRTCDIPVTTCTALSMCFTGINAHGEDLLKDRSLTEFVKARNLILFVCGHDLKHQLEILTYSTAHHLFHGPLPV